MVNYEETINKILNKKTMMVHFTTDFYKESLTKKALVFLKTSALLGVKACFKAFLPFLSFKIVHDYFFLLARSSRDGWM